MHKGDQVFARQGPLLYEATIMEILKDDTCIIHYKGFNAKFDEMVKIANLMEINKENTTLKENLEQYYSENKNELPSVSSQLHYLNQRSVSLDLPLPLRARLADDFEAINQQGMLVPLPHKINLHEVIQRFGADQMTNDVNIQSSDLQEFCKGLIWYFNCCLPCILLYPKERLQFHEFLQEEPSNIYGADHLLRLLVQMPLILKESNLPAGKLSQLQQFLMDLMDWLQHHRECFCRYVSVSLEHEKDLEHHIVFN